MFLSIDGRMDDKFISPFHGTAPSEQTTSSVSFQQITVNQASILRTCDRSSRLIPQHVYGVWTNSAGDDSLLAAVALDTFLDPLLWRHCNGDPTIGRGHI
jgi:hypothetical protein